MNTATSTLLIQSKFHLTDLIAIGLDNWYEIAIKINWLVILFIIVLISFPIYKYLRKNKKPLQIDGAQLGIGNITFNITRNKIVQEIAYKIWVELVTRKVAIQVEDNDVIVEVYDSWYSAFKEIRNLIKIIPGKNLEDAYGLIDLTIKILNDGLRPHLTIWQADFRKWYSKEKEQNQEKRPQEIQRKYEKYNDLFNDMKKTNNYMINFAKELEKIAFDKNN